MKKLALVLAIACVAAGGVGGFYVGKYASKREAALLGHAHYEKTGDIEWGGTPNSLLNDTITNLQDQALLGVCNAYGEMAEKDEICVSLHEKYKEEPKKAGEK